MERHSRDAVKLCSRSAVNSEIRLVLLDAPAYQLASPASASAYVVWAVGLSQV